MLLQAQELKQRDVPLLIYQGRLNLIDRAPQDEGILDFCASNGIGFISFSPLAQGLLTDKYLKEIPSDSRMARNGSLRPEMLDASLLNRLQQYNAMAARRGETLARMALEWILAQRGITSVLVGASSVGQLSENLKCIDAKPFEEDI